MGKSLIIVESPAKTKTYKNFLGNDFLVEASMGHVRDLPTREIGVDVQNGFTPKYVTIRERRDVLKRLASAAKNAEVVYLASDPDREGEAIAWHLAQALKLKQPRRIHVNEITRAAVAAALANPGTINQNLVEAQEARRILDRLVGYRLSPLLWKKVQKNLSAGRVQSVVVRLICDREREIQAFVSEEYWSITAQLTPAPPKERFPFEAKLIGRLAQEQTEESADSSPRVEKVNLSNQAEAQAVLDALGYTSETPAPFSVRSVTQTTKRRAPAPPFITSTLQQEASRKLGFNNRRTMSVAQALYEGVDLGVEGPVGLITYMRTDSTRIAREAQEEIRAHIRRAFGDDYVPEKPPTYASRAGAQDAHEAIRPTSVERTPESLANKLSAEQLKLYRLIWQRAVASQMVSAVFDVTRADIQAAGYVFRATGSVMKFDGFLRVYREGRDTEQEEEEEDRAPLPSLAANQVLELIELLPKQHFTEPPPRYTEATLVKTMEEKGIGRPSTYASIIATIQDREYVKQVDKRFYPTELGMAVTVLLVKHFPKVMDVGFTADMENHLDEIEQGGRQKTALLTEFYEPFEQALNDAHSQMESLKPAAVQTEHLCPNCGKPMMLRQSRRGPFLGCSGYPKCRTVLNIGDDGAPLPEDQRPQPEVTDQTCPKCGKPLVKRMGRLGPFLGCSGYPKCKTIVNLPQTEEGQADQTLREAVAQGEACPKCGKPMVERTGRYGKFLGCSGYPECKTIVRIRRVDAETTESSTNGAGEQAGSQPEYPPCPTCGRALVKRNGKRGAFLGCSGYPKCKTIVSLDQAAEPENVPDPAAIEGVVCPKDGGALLERKSGRGSTFYGCANYPACDYTTSLRLVGRPCPECGWPLGEKRGRGKAPGVVQCSNPDCGYRE